MIESAYKDCDTNIQEYDEDKEYTMTDELEAKTSKFLQKGKIKKMYDEELEYMMEWISAYY